jgi:hypothetical protein
MKRSWLSWRDIKRRGIALGIASGWSRGAGPWMEDLDVTKILSLLQIGCVSRQAGADVSAPGAAVCFGARAIKSTALWLILCVMFGFWISSESATADRPARAVADGFQPSASIAGVRIANGRRLTNSWAEVFPLSNAALRNGANGIHQNLGVALFVSGLSPYLPQRLPRRSDNCAFLREPEEYQQAGEQHPFPFNLEFLAGLFLCGVVSWGGALWVERR